MVESLKGEVWKVYPHDVRYKVSNFGRVIGAKGKLLTPYVNEHHGYTTVYIGTPKRLHRVVMDSFDPDGSGEVVCHNDGDKGNNRLDNLRRDTQKNNLLDREKHGTFQRGETGANNKLAEQQVLEIKELLKRNAPCTQIALHYGVNRVTVSNIKLGKSWKCIEESKPWIFSELDALAKAMIKANDRTIKESKIKSGLKRRNRGATDAS